MTAGGSQDRLDPAHVSAKRRGATALKVAVVAGAGAFVAVVALSAVRSSTPTGAAPDAGVMPGMAAARPGGRIAVTLRDVDGATHRVPGGRPGAMVFVEPSGCPSCRSAVAAAARARRDLAPRVDVHALSLDGDASRGQIHSFLRAAGARGLPVVLDTRLGDLGAYFDAPGLGAAIVYDAHGRVQSAAYREAVAPGHLGGVLARVARASGTAQGRVSGGR